MFFTRREHTRKYKGKLIQVRESKVKKKKDNNHLVRNTLLAATGITLGSYLLARNRYRKQLPFHIKSALLNRSKHTEFISSIIPQIEKHNNSVTFLTTGMNVTDFEIYPKLMQNTLRNKSYVIAKPNTHNSRWLKTIFNTTRNLVHRGKNADTQDTLEKVLELIRQKPDAKINIVGYSAGGISNFELNELLNRMSIKHNIINLATPQIADLGFFKNTTHNFHTVVSSKDPLRILGGMYNKKLVQTPDLKFLESHYYRNIMKDPNIQNEIKNTIL